MREFGTWLLLNRTIPDYQRIVRSEMDHLTRALRLVADDILAGDEVADATHQTPPPGDPA